ncbi:MAG TPA: hypothetical protein VFU46_06060 [Gemmatimonadales bacterium]|nr:hypothetical protein [Gemmatimonadales bacterium]
MWVTLLLIFIIFPPLTPAWPALPAVFAPGDLLLSFENGSVQWRDPAGRIKSVLVSTVPGPAEGMNFDSAGNLYVARWCGPFCYTGDTVEKFNANGVSQGRWGSGYCSPHAIDFDGAGNAYVGQADCAGIVLKLSGGAVTTAYAVATENRGSFWIDLAPDGCTLFYTSWGPNVKRFNVCTSTQLPNFNQTPLPGGETHGLRVLPDGGVLVSSGAVIVRLNASGAVTQTYSLPTAEAQYWAGLDLVGDGTFWAANYLPSGVFNANIFRFDLATGQVRASFDTGTPPEDVVDIRVSRGAGL